MTDDVQFPRAEQMQQVARKMNEQARKVNEQKAKASLEGLLKRIQEEAQAGRFGVEVEAKALLPSPSVEELLKELGYQVVRPPRHQLDPPVVLITW